MENGNGDILPADIFGQQVLDIRFGENTAARGDIMDMLGFFSQAVQLFDGDSQKYSHLVQKSSSAPGTVAVHAQIAASIGFDVHDFCVFSTDVNQRSHFWIFGFDELGGSDHFLFKWKLEFFCYPHAHGTGDLQLQAGSSDLGTQSLQFFPQNGSHIGLMALVAGKNHMGMIVQHDDFARGGPDV